MRHASSRDFFGYWDRQRGTAAAPTRQDFEPSAVAHLLGDSFVLSRDLRAGHPIRAAGTRLCALFGRDLKNSRFMDLWGTPSRDTLAPLIDGVAAESLPVVAGVSAVSTTGVLTLELLLLPFAARAHTPPRLTGLLVPLTVSPQGGRPITGDLVLTTWRHLEVTTYPQCEQPRAVQVRSLLSGFLVYEGRDRNA